MTTDFLSTSLVEWSRSQFAVTAMYHYLFVPLTLGLSFIIAIMETMWVRTNNPEWLRATKFWMKIFGINFAIGVATGIIMEFQFGTNWSNYSWFVGDIFGAPLAIEGILAFFLESTFIAVMFFGWKKVSKRFHLASTWLVFIGANISALWILVANAWMQNPVGMEFNPVTLRNEMKDFWAVLFSPTAISKFLHTITAAYTLSSCVVIGISAWYIMKRRHLDFSYRSIKLASIFGLVSIILTIFTGDLSSKDIAKTQPIKLAAMEGLNKGSSNCGLAVIGYLTDSENPTYPNKKDVKMRIEIPSLLSFMSFNNSKAFVPGIEDIINGYTNCEGEVIPSLDQRVENGKKAIAALDAFKKANEEKDFASAEIARKELQENYNDLGYGYLESKYDAIPPVPIVFYSFRIMVGIGIFFILLFILSIRASMKKNVRKIFIYLAIISVPLSHIATQAGWIVAEFGRQPWVVKDLLPTHIAATDIMSGWVITTFWMFAIIFTVLLIAELKIMFTQIKKGPEKSINTNLSNN